MEVAEMVVQFGFHWMRSPLALRRETVLNGEPAVNPGPRPMPVPLAGELYLFAMPAATLRQ